MKKTQGTCRKIKLAWMKSFSRGRVLLFRKLRYPEPCYFKNHNFHYLKLTLKRSRTCRALWGNKTPWCPLFLFVEKVKFDLRCGRKHTQTLVLRNKPPQLLSPFSERQILLLLILGQIILSPIPNPAPPRFKLIIYDPTWRKPSGVWVGPASPLKHPFMWLSYYSASDWYCNSNTQETPHCGSSRMSLGPSGPLLPKTLSLPKCQAGILGWSRWVERQGILWTLNFKENGFPQGNWTEMLRNIFILCSPFFS